MHYYSWYPFSVNIAGGTHYDDAAQSDLNDAFARMRDTFVAKGIPVYLGEYGLLGYPDHNHPSRVERGEALKYYEHLGHAARLAGVTTALWDPGTLAYLNRETLKWTDPALMAWIKSSWTTRSANGLLRQGLLGEEGADHRQGGHPESERDHVPGPVARRDQARRGTGLHPLRQDAARPHGRRADPAVGRPRSTG